MPLRPFQFRSPVAQDMMRRVQAARGPRQSVLSRQLAPSSGPQIGAEVPLGDCIAFVGDEPRMFYWVTGETKPRTMNVEILDCRTGSGETECYVAPGGIGRWLPRCEGFDTATAPCLAYWGSTPVMLRWATPASVNPQGTPVGVGECVTSPGGTMCKIKAPGINRWVPRCPEYDSTQGVTQGIPQGPAIPGELPPPAPPSPAPVRRGLQVAPLGPVAQDMMSRVQAQQLRRFPRPQQITAAPGARSDACCKALGTCPPGQVCVIEEHPLSTECYCGPAPISMGAGGGPIPNPVGGLVAGPQVASGACSDLRCPPGTYCRCKTWHPTGETDCWCEPLPL